MSRRRRSLPAFLIIGAQRSGTTSLFYDLCRHPQITGASGKEVHFFDHQFWRGVDWYRSFFPPLAAQARARRSGGELLGGEATPYYLFHPGVPARVAETLPDALFVVLLRSPADRAKSHHRRSVALNVERLPFEEALAAESERLAGEEERLLGDLRYRSFSHRHHSYVTRGLYAEQLERWFRYFPRERFLVMRAEDFFCRPGETYARTLRFLDLAHFDPGEFKALNPSMSEPMAVETRELLERRFAEPNERLAQLLGTEVWWPVTERLS